jgi:charged multivesicular body protein 6
LPVLLSCRAFVDGRQHNMGNSQPSPGPPAVAAANAPAKPAAAQFTAHDKAVMEVKVMRDRLYKQRKKMTGETAKLTDSAKELLKSGKRDRAALMLKMRRFREAELERVERQIANLENMVQDLERADIQAKMFESLKSGTAALKSLQALMPLEDVEKLMEENEEAVQYSNELSEMLARSMNPSDEVQAQGDLEAMLNELALPHVPQTVPVILPAQPSESEAQSAKQPASPQQARQAQKQPLLA